MSIVRNVMDIRVNSAKQQADTIRAFATTPTGVFETADVMVATFRQANKATLAALRLPTLKMRGQIKVLDLVRRGRRRIF